MRVRTTLALLGTAAVAAGVLAPAAHAADSGATFQITAAASSVTISVPASTVDLGSAAAGAASIAKNLGMVTVTDARSKLAPVWTVNASSTDFVLSGGTGTAEEKVAATDITYTPGAVTYTGSGTGAFVATPISSMSAPLPVGVYTGVVGSRTVSWNPTVTLPLNANQVAGTYNGIITHSVTVTS